MHFITYLLLLLPALAAALAQSFNQSGWVCAPGGVSIREWTYAGTGCKAGTVAATIPNNGKTLTIAHDNYVASQVATGTEEAARRACQYTFKFTFPSGYSYSVLTADYRGYAPIGPAAQGLIKATYYFAGQRRDQTVNMTIPSNYYNNYAMHNDAEVETLSSHAASLGTVR